MAEQTSDGAPVPARVPVGPFYYRTGNPYYTPWGYVEMQEEVQQRFGDPPGRPPLEIQLGVLTGNTPSTRASLQRLREQSRWIGSRSTVCFCEAHRRSPRGEPWETIDACDQCFVETVAKELSNNAR